MMTFFKTSDQRYEVENHLFWMYRVTYEIEMHINAVLNLDRLISENGLRGDLSTDMIFYHNELALIRTAYALIKTILDKISLFYKKYQGDIDKLINRRDAEAHEFKTKEQIKISNENPISFNKQMEVIQEVRKIINDLYVVLFRRDMSPDLKYPIDMYGKIYDHSIEIIASNLDRN